MSNIVAAEGIRPEISNLTGSQFTVSWVSELPNTSYVQLYQDDALLKTLFDDRGKHYFGCTHYITIIGLNENTEYNYVINEIQGEEIINDGQRYHITTGQNMIPVGTFQPAGQVFLDDGQTPALNSIVYITVSNSNEQSAPLSTIVDKNGFWFVELINARNADYQSLYPLSNSDILGVKVYSEQKDDVHLEMPVKNIKDRTQMCSPIILN